MSIFPRFLHSFFLRDGASDFLENLRNLKECRFGIFLCYSYRVMYRDDVTPPNRLRPAWITPELMAETRGVFQPLYPKEDLTDDEIVGLLQNVGGLFEVLYHDLTEQQHGDEEIRQDEDAGQADRK